MSHNNGAVFTIYREVFKRKRSLANLDYISRLGSYEIGIFSKKSNEGYRVVLHQRGFYERGV